MEEGDWSLTKVSGGAQIKNICTGSLGSTHTAPNQVRVSKGFLGIQYEEEMGEIVSKGTNSSLQDKMK